MRAASCAAAAVDAVASTDRCDNLAASSNYGPATVDLAAPGVDITSTYPANRYVRRTVKVNGRPETRGGVKGSFPVSGDYGPYEFVNWACKFSVDSNLLEKAVRGV